jgi:3-phenylpropionate/trans-cinnamate dioxygenase ferredoxin reductase subunit
MRKRYKLVIAGGGLAATRAIKSYREAGGEGRIALVAREPTLPYHRPPLSKRYLRGETEEIPHVEDRGFYREHDVGVLLGTSVTGLDAATRRVTIDGGGALAYERLLIATGATPRRLDVPGADFEGVYTLRTVADSAAIRDAAGAAERAVVVGGGFVGMEVAASLRQLGVAVTLIHLGRGLFDQLGSRELSAGLASLYRTNGVEVLLGEEVSSFDGRSRVEAVTTRSGRRVETDLAVVGAGVVPAVEFLRGTGVALANGVVVNERFEASVPGVYAVGDVANFFDPLYGRHRRIEHWSNASYQGIEAGKALAGREGRYDTASTFFSEFFDVRLKVFGDVGRFDERDTTGSLAARDLVVTYGDDGRLVGALTIGQSDETEARLKELVAAGAPVGAVDRASVLAAVS